jgi:hypothetical protein
MAEEHDYIIRLVSPDLRPEHYGWDRIARDMDKVCGELSAETEDTLLRVLGCVVEIPAPEGAQSSHMFTLLGALQARALGALAAWGPKHRAAIEAFAEHTESAMLESIARSVLKQLKASTRR